MYNDIPYTHVKYRMSHATKNQMWLVFKQLQQFSIANVLFTIENQLQMTIAKYWISTSALILFVDLNNQFILFTSCPQSTNLPLSQQKKKSLHSWRSQTFLLIWY